MNPMDQFALATGGEYGYEFQDYGDEEYTNTSA